MTTNGENSEKTQEQNTSIEGRLQVTDAKEGDVGRVEVAYTRTMLVNIFKDIIGIRPTTDDIQNGINKKTIIERRNTFLSNFKDNIFEDEYRIIYGIVSEFRSMDINLEFATLIINSNKRYYIHNLKIDTGRFATVDGEDPENAVANITINTVNNLIESCTTNGFTAYDEWENYLHHYREVYKNGLLLTALDNAKIILTEGVGEGKYKVLGLEDSVNYMTKSLSEIERIGKADTSMGLISAKDYVESGKTGKDRIKLMDMGLPAIDTVKNGLYSGTITTILAPPKNLKTRLSYALGHRAAVYFNQNVLIWPIEGGVARGTTYLRSMHFCHYHNFLNPKTEAEIESLLQDGDVADVVALPNTKILNNSLNPLETRWEAESQYDLFYNTDYGSIYFIDEDFTFTNFISVLDSYVLKTGARILIIDYITLIQAGAARFGSRADMLQETYAKLVRWATSRGVAIISPAQVKQVHINELASGQPTSDPRTWAGETSAVVRDSDNIIVLYSTDEMRAAHQLRFYDAATRDSAPFEPFNAFVDEGSGLFLPSKGYSLDSTGTVYKVSNSL